MTDTRIIEVRHCNQCEVWDKCTVTSNNGTPKEGIHKDCPLPKKQVWIDVNERLPEDGEYKLGVIDGTHIAEVMYVIQLSVWIDWNGKEVNVTYYMDTIKLPTPPEK